MREKSGACAALLLLTFMTPAWAEDDALPHPSGNPTTGFFIGVGGGYNSTDFTQNLDASGISAIFLDDALVALGEAGGPSTPFRDTQSKLAPEVHLGFFRDLTDNGWMWGTKFKYKYLNQTSTDNIVDSPQSGAFINTAAAPANTTFTGNVVIESSQARITHELSFLALIAHPFMNGNLYFGAGPALFATKSNIYGATGFADINGVHFDITGVPADFSNSEWVWGGAAQIGMTYNLGAKWFLDFSYTYSLTPKYKTNYSGAFATTAAGYNDIGTLFINPAERVNSQAFAVSINKRF